MPFYLTSDEDGGQGTLQCHLARGNPVWRRLQGGARVLVVFQGPDAYISPSLYATKAETGRVVPTWNYLAVHVEGRARVVDDAGWLTAHLHRLTDQQERVMSAPWSVDDASEDFTDRLIAAIVGVEIMIESLTGKVKASQNQPEKNRQSVKAGLEAAGEDSQRAIAMLIR